MGKGIPRKNPRVPIRAKVRSQRKKAGLPWKIERIRGYIKADAKRRPPRKRSRIFNSREERPSNLGQNRLPIPADTRREKITRETE
jgi:hypothetical protein